MDVNSYLTSDSFKKKLTLYTENVDLESIDKLKSDIKMCAADSFNEGVASMCLKKKNGNVNTSILKKSNEITNLLPDFFVKKEIGIQALESLIEAVKLVQSNSILNIGYDVVLKEQFANTLRIVYAIGLSAGFEIADDEDYRSLFLSNKDRFILHGSESITKNEGKSNSGTTN